MNRNCKDIRQFLDNKLFEKKGGHLVSRYNFVCTYQTIYDLSYPVSLTLETIFSEPWITCFNKL